MYNLDRVLFDMNEGLHRVGVIQDDKYMTQGSFLFAILVAVVLLPFIMRESNHKYFAFITPVLISFFLYMMGEYFIIMLVILMIRFIHIIYKYPQYSNMRELLERWF